MGFYFVGQVAIGDWIMTVLSSSQYGCDVLVLGGGIAGRTLALLLAQHGFDVVIAEQENKSLDAGEVKDPRAYALNANAVDLFKKLRVWSHKSACPVYDMQVCDGERAKLVFSAWQQEVDVLTYIVPAFDVEKALDHALDFQPRIQRVSAQEGPRAMVHAKLVAICEGRESVTRAQFGFEMQTKNYGHMALAARLSCTLPHGHVARQWFKGGVLALLPLVSEVQGAHEVSLVWSVPDAQGRVLKGLSPEDFVAALYDATQGVLGSFELQTMVASWPLRFAYAKHWVMRRDEQTAVLVGDAAHAMHPLAGQGLNTGLGDVVKLADVLGQAPAWRSVDDERLLRSYERARKAAFMKVGGGCDALFEFFMNEQSAVEMVRQMGMVLVDHTLPLKRWLAAQARNLS